MLILSLFPLFVFFTVGLLTGIGLLSTHQTNKPMAVILSAVENMDHGNLDVKTSILIWMMGSQRHKLGRFKDVKLSIFLATLS